MMSVLLEGALDEELDEELGYSKYDYRNKETDNSRNGHSSKTMHTSYGDMDVAIPRDRNGDYEPQLIKKYQNTVTLQGAMPLSQLFEVLFDSCIFRKNRALAPHERSAVPIGNDIIPVTICKYQQLAHLDNHRFHDASLQLSS